LQAVVNETECVCVRVHVRGFAGGSVYDQSLIMHTNFHFLTSYYIAGIHSILALFFCIRGLQKMLQ